MLQLFGRMPLLGKEVSDLVAADPGQRSGPVAIYDDDKPRAGWAEILLLAERLAPTPVPLAPVDEARVLPATGGRTTYWATDP